MKCVLLMLSALILSACCAKPPPPIVVTTTKVIYPSLPDVKAPSKLMLDQTKFDWPRDTSKLSILNTSKCRAEYAKLYGDNPVAAVPVDSYSTALMLEQNPKFWTKCSINAVDQNSNLYVGLDELNYKNLVNNFNLLISREKQWNNTLDAINSMLLKWRKKYKESLKQ